MTVSKTPVNGVNGMSMTNPTMVEAPASSPILQSPIFFSPIKEDQENGSGSLANRAMLSLRPNSPFGEPNDGQQNGNSFSLVPTPISKQPTAPHGWWDANRTIPMPPPYFKADEQPKVPFGDERLQGFYAEIQKIREAAIYEPVNPTTGAPLTALDERHDTFSYDEVLEAARKSLTPVKNPQNAQAAIWLLPTNNPIRQWVERSGKNLIFEADLLCPKYKTARALALEVLRRLAPRAGAAFANIKAHVENAKGALCKFLLNDTPNIEKSGLRQDLNRFSQLIEASTFISTLEKSVMEQWGDEASSIIKFPDPFNPGKMIEIDKMSPTATAECQAMQEFYENYSKFLDMNCSFLKNLISPMVKAIGIFQGFPGPYTHLTQRSESLLEPKKEAKETKKNGTS